MGPSWAIQQVKSTKKKIHFYQMLNLNKTTLTNIEKKIKLKYSSLGQVH
jgi:hypothetical protein